MGRNKLKVTNMQLMRVHQWKTKEAKLVFLLLLNVCILYSETLLQKNTHAMLPRSVQVYHIIVIQATFLHAGGILFTQIW